MHFSCYREPTDVHSTIKYFTTESITLSAFLAAELFTSSQRRQHTGLFLSNHELYFPASITTICCSDLPVYSQGNELN